MSLKDVIEETKEQLKEAEKREEAVIEEEVKEEKPVEELKKEEVKEEVKEEEKPKTNADFARERRAKVAKEQRLTEELAAANARIAQLIRPKEEERPVERDVEPSKADDPQAWMEWDNRQTRKEAQSAREEAKKANQRVEREENIRRSQNLRETALNELRVFEDQAKQQVDDYDDAKSFYASALALGIKAENPSISPHELAERVNDKILTRASILYNEGHENPLLAMRDDAIALGYKKQPKEIVEEEKKPDLSRVAVNRSRNAGTAGAAGSTGRGELTKNVLATMTTAEYAKVPVAERKRIMMQH